jgi:hypothetical protein
LDSGKWMKTGKVLAVLNPWYLKKKKEKRTRQLEVREGTLNARHICIERSSQISFVLKKYGHKE